jgi:hypothetical protein
MPMDVCMLSTWHTHTWQSIVTHQLPMDKFEEGFGLVLGGKDSVKVVLIPPN